ncbi:hypothetical protein OGAPHI_005704 [Ogataea philodendri]|uniref:Biogenesis of lysosome-related organelles complex 1 subunit 2 n=1 Tax=Ogataea philodendri TaxID=1378263 RepID=A0A9P8NZN0_9ASCO|nr:uncharacterized protein OGAPHI_005704 [Ogataea philodendri]KAH3662452.1 hypothetical protein OGAPHI_005704 [Ogataea philodendri]
MSSSNDSRTLIRTSYECLRRILEIDTQSTLAQLNLMESLNNSAILKYKEIETYLDGLETDTAHISALDRELHRSKPQLDTLEARVQKLAVLVDQIDEWSAELEVKSRHYHKS